jgi:excinuclease ABC subunit A
LLGATEHNLKDIDISIPLNTLTVVTGVSGSGKSTLVHDVLYAAVKRAKGGWDRRVGAFRKLEGIEYITDAVLVDQRPSAHAAIESRDVSEPSIRFASCSPRRRTHERAA